MVSSTNGSNMVESIRSDVSWTERKLKHSSFFSESGKQPRLRVITILLILTTLCCLFNIYNSVNTVTITSTNFAFLEKDKFQQSPVNGKQKQQSVLPQTSNATNPKIQPDTNSNQILAIEQERHDVTASFEPASERRETENTVKLGALLASSSTSDTGNARSGTKTTTITNYTNTNGQGMSQPLSKHTIQTPATNTRSTAIAIRADNKNNVASSTFGRTNVGRVPHFKTYPKSTSPFIEAYRSNVTCGGNGGVGFSTSVVSDNAWKAAIDCLQKTKPKISSFPYPEDAWEHFNDIRMAVAKWSQLANHKPHDHKGYSGPWIENYWITHFEGLINDYQCKNTTNPKQLSDIFGPYVPLFIPWTDSWSYLGRKYPSGLPQMLLKTLREDVLYITVCQNADGLPGMDDDMFLLQEKYHIVVLSAGGYGHVPIPLLKQPEAVRNQRVPVSNRTHVISYVGSYTNAPHEMRQKMLKQLDAPYAAKHLQKNANEKNAYGFLYYQGNDWRDVMTDSKFQLCPRGYGRTSFHIMESFQMGLIPVQVYLDEPWIPYQKFLLENHLLFVTDLNNLTSLVHELRQIPDERIEAMEKHIVNLRDKLFSFEGIIKQIQGFMLGDGSSDLLCQKMPDTPRAADYGITESHGKEGINQPLRKTITMPTNQKGSTAVAIRPDSHNKVVATSTGQTKPGSLPSTIVTKQYNLSPWAKAYQSKVTCGGSGVIVSASMPVRTSVVSEDALQAAIGCLQKTKTNMDVFSFQYPEDALEHFNEIRMKLAQWSQHSRHRTHEYKGYSGPWIENYWITHFEGLADALNCNPHNITVSLSDIFGPYVPLFLPWTDFWAMNGRKYPTGLPQLLLETLREDVMYITVCQNADGLPGMDEDMLRLQERFNIVVLSAGGYGHVPIPLLKQPENVINDRVPVSKRKHFLTYVGSKQNAPQKMRATMIKELLALLGSRIGNDDSFDFTYYTGERWRDLMTDSKFQLCPRGYGRTSFHVVETLQMGLIPIQVYIDEPWIPYKNFLLDNNLVFATDLNNLTTLVEQLKDISDESIEATEKEIVNVRSKFFTFEGIMKQIQGFMLGDGSSELVCQKLPDTPRAADYNIADNRLAGT